VPGVTGGPQESPGPLAASTVGAAKCRRATGGRLIGLPLESLLGEPPLAASDGPGLREFPLTFPEIRGLCDFAFPFPALRRLGELAGPRLPPFRKLLLQIDGSEFYI
jgi:hypothetical protein